MNNNGENQTKEKEVFSEHQFHLPDKGTVKLFSELAENDLTNSTSSWQTWFAAGGLKSAGRFKSPRSDADRLLSKVHLKMLEIMEPDDLYSFGNPDYPVPPEWQEIFNYLYEEGIAAFPRVQFESFFHDEPKIYSLRLDSAPVSGLTDGHRPRFSNYSRGVSEDFEEALSKVIGELLERYPLTLYRTKDFTRGSYRALKEKKKNPLDIFGLAGFADWQKELFPNRRFDDNSEFSWVDGVELLSGKPALIPSQLVFWNYNFDLEQQEPFLRQPITNGAAGHFTKKEAILAGIYENIQRDAFLIYWLNNIVSPRIDSRTVRDEQLKRIITDFDRYEFEVVFLNTTFDLKVPSCVCVFMDKSGKGPKVGVGGGCGPDLEKAMMRSITEATGVYHWLRSKGKPFVLPLDYKPFTQKGIGQEARLMFWANRESFKMLERFLCGPLQSLDEAAGTYPSFFSNPSDELEYVKEILAKAGKGYEIYAYEAKHPVLDSLGYHSVRTVIPALIPLYLEETNATLGSARLKNAPRRMGCVPSDAPNPLPHPFP